MNEIKKIPFSLVYCDKYELDLILNKVAYCMEEAKLPVKYGDKVLVKPNLLLPKLLACAHPFIIYAVCVWLREKGCNIIVGDSPGFGSVQKISAFLGLDSLLARLNLKIISFRKTRKIQLETNYKFPMSVLALEQDHILSVAKLKAHSQMQMMLAVKNCYGCVPGLHKALLHTKYGNSHNEFGKLIVSIWKQLPPVSGVMDAITAMNYTGPSRGEPIDLNFIACCRETPLLDKVILDILNIPWTSVPITNLTKEIWENQFPEFSCLKPEDLKLKKFTAPEKLESASFKPTRLLKSLIKRFYSQYFKKIQNNH